MEQLEQIFMWKMIALSAVLMMILMLGYMIIISSEKFREGVFFGIRTTHDRIIRLPKLTRFTVDQEINQMIVERASDQEEKRELLEVLELNKHEYTV